MSKKIIKITKSDLNTIIKESVSKILKEYDYDEDNYYGGGLPDNYFNNDNEPENDRISVDDLGKLEKYSQEIADIANNRSDDCDGIFDALEILDNYIERKKMELLNFSKH